MDWNKFNMQNILFSRIDRKLTLLFIIVGVLAPALAIYYFYLISLSSLQQPILIEQDAVLGSVALAIIILIGVNAGFIGFLVSRSISKPIKELYRVTREVEKGNYDVRIDAKTSDEIGILRNAFNRTTRALGRLEEERKEIDSAKTEFLSITSHELRSPMTPMKAQLQMMEDGYFGKLNDKQKESLGIIVRNADRLDKIIVDFLEISRIEAARLRFNFREVDLTKVVQDTAKFMEGFAKEKNIELNLNIDNLPIIEADPDRVSQVLSNIIHNAIKFSKENSTIEIEARKKENYIEFSVKDHGCGITSENQTRIFEPFFQIEDAARRKHGGTGLGLAICRGIIESQKGKIWVESKPRGGCKFYFTVPLEPVYKIEPIKVLFSHKDVIDKKIREEFKTKLGPLGIGEFNELKNKNALGKEDLFEYVDFLTKLFILTPERGEVFKNKIGEIFGEEKDVVINENKDTLYDGSGEEVLKRD